VERDYPNNPNISLLLIIKIFKVKMEDLVHDMYEIYKKGLSLEYGMYEYDDFLFYYYSGIDIVIMNRNGGIGPISVEIWANKRNLNWKELTLEDFQVMVFETSVWNGGKRG